ncbi:MAG: nucleotidyltransferase domain-containing protein [Armatimonadota bacterium]|nr:nucleotidyltransferase domain-containing protein [Armatimonadota bacterium]MDT7971551.1 nucleotidyltransferase domain-containing protein [Armatimonadota bacterium]
MHEVLRRRKAQKEERIATARTYAERLRQRLGALTAWLYGSVARGTFKDWSDIDVFIVAETLPSHPLQRNDLLYQDAPIGIEPKGWTKAEFERGLAKRDPALLAMLKDRIVLVDDLGLEDALRKTQGEKEDVRKVMG